MTDRGASETLGFVMVFAIVVSTIGVVYATGFSGLQAAKDAEQLTNMERAFDVLDDNVRDLDRRGAPSRATEVKLAGGDLFVGDSIDVHVSTNSSDPGLCNETRTLSIAPRPLVYEEEDTQIVYAAGALFRTDDGGSVMLSRPGWIEGSRRSVLPLLTVVPGDRTNMGGRTTVLVVAREESDSLQCSFENPSSPLRVNVTVDSPRSGAWERYFEDRGYDVEEVRSGVVAGKFNTSRLYVTETSVEIEIQP